MTFWAFGGDIPARKFGAKLSSTSLLAAVKRGVVRTSLDAGTEHMAMSDKKGFFGRSDQGDEFSSPIEVFRPWDDQFHFTLDVCASPRNHKTRHYFTKKHDALSQPWAPHVCWMNPPYSAIFPWCQKGYEESQRGATVVALLPVWTATAWFHEFIKPCAEINFLSGRVRFLRRDGTIYNNPMMSSMIVIWRPR